MKTVKFLDLNSIPIENSLSVDKIINNYIKESVTRMNS